MADRKLRYPILWVLFLMSTIAGAGMLLRPDGQNDALAIGLLLLPLVAFGAILGVFYWKSRRIT